MAVQGATIIPTAEDIRAAISGLRNLIETDEAAKTALFSDPRGFLGDRGFARDLQREFLREQGYAIGADCENTCIATSSVCCETV